MSDKKHMGSKLAQSVRQVQSERDEQRNPAKVTVAPDQQTPAQSAPAAPVTGATAPGDQNKKKALHPKRVWPD